MDDEEDIKKIDEILNKHKHETTEIGEDGEYEDFINYETISSDSENELEECIFVDFNEKTQEETNLNTYDSSSVLKHEERLIIESCKNDELKTLLVLNRNKNIQLIQLHKQIKDALLECIENIREKEEIIDSLRNKKNRNTYMKGIWRLGHPYFKDVDLFSHPSNADTLKKNRNNELTFYDLLPLPRWRKNEMNKLLRAVKINYNLTQQKKISKELELLSNKSKNKKENNETTELKAKLEHLQNESNYEIPDLIMTETIDWNRISDVFFKNKRSEIECKAMWSLFLHPNINKSKFSNEENDKLIVLVEQHKLQNWEKICNELNTNRTFFTVCTHYFRNLHEKFKKNERFTQEEDEMLYTLVKSYKIGDYIPWCKLAEHFKNRSRQSIFYRYKYYLSKSGKCKIGRFSDEEDVLLMILVDKFGRDFKKCSDYFENRTNVQLRCRYTSNLCGVLRKGTFTIEEDEEIMKFAVENRARSWISLAKRLKRASGQLRQRYDKIKQYLAENPGSEIKDVVRRKHSYAGEKDDNYHYLRYVADAYKFSATIPTLPQLKSVLGKNREGICLSELNELTQINGHSPGHIDELLIDFFSDSFKMSNQRHIAHPQLNSAIKLVNDLLNILNVNLKVPRNFDEDFRLDNIDVAILCGLEKYRNIFEPKQTKKKVVKLIPPNLNTLVGIRSLLIKYCVNEGAECNVNIFDDFSKNSPRKTNIETSAGFLREQKLFYKRFVSLFKFPAIITLQEPNQRLINTSNSYNFNIPLVVSKRTYTGSKKEPKLKKAAQTITKPPETKSLADKLKEKIQDELNNLQTKTKTPKIQNNSYILSSANTSVKSVLGNKKKPTNVTIKDVLVDQPATSTAGCQETNLKSPDSCWMDSTSDSCQMDSTSDSCQGGKKILTVDYIPGPWRMLEDTTDSGLVISKNENNYDEDVMSDLVDIKKIDEILAGEKSEEFFL